MPAGRRIAVSDIHGCAETLRVLLAESLQIQPADEVYLLGDYLDRGPDSKGVLDLIMAYRDAGYPLTCLRGNHEAMFLKALDDPDSHALWAYVNGGLATLESFGAAEASDIPDYYQALIKELGYYVPLEDRLLVHAGFNFEAAAPFADYEAMLWIRGFQPDPVITAGRPVIHGHTPRSFDRIQANIEEEQPQTVNIDNGCAYPKPGMQGLVALDLDTFALTRQPNVEPLAGGTS
jgi:serine/threonine protein phosphatase 1